MEKKFKVVSHAHAITDRYVEEMSRLTEESGKSITCSRGCFACCKEPVLATKDEVLYLLDMLTEEQRAEVAAKTREWINKVQMSDILSNPLPHVFLYRLINNL